MPGYTSVPTEALDAAGHLLDRHLRNEAVVDGNEDITLVSECLRFLLNTRLVTCFPASAMNPDDHRKILGLGRGVNVQQLAFVLWVGVGEIPMDFRLRGEERGAGGG